MTEKSNCWGIVLAAGEGNRVRDFLSALCGGRGIKQFCAVWGGKSLLEMTLGRVQTLIPRERILIIVDRRHRPEASEQLAGWPAENIIYQPANRETAPGILLPLAHISQRDRRATVAVFPSDHFVLKERLFASYVSQALAESEKFPHSAVLLGMKPDRLEEGYGWISARAGRSSEASHAVRRFREKPTMQEAEQLMMNGALWNSFVFAARAQALWKMTQLTVPELHRLFSLIRVALHSRHADELVERVYERMPTVNFSHAVLTPWARRLRVLPVPEIGWSDWGSADRILDSAQRLGWLADLTARLRERRIDDPAISTLLSRYQPRPPLERMDYQEAVA